MSRNFAAISDIMVIRLRCKTTMTHTIANVTCNTTLRHDKHYVIKVFKKRCKWTNNRLQLAFTNQITEMGVMANITCTYDERQSDTAFTDRRTV